MSPEPARRFGRTPVQAARAAVLLALLGAGAIVAVVRLLTRPGTPLGTAFEATGIPPWLPLSAGIAVVLVLAAAGFVQSVRAADRFLLTEEGLEISGRLGGYRLAWDNIERGEVTPSGGLGIRVRSREAVTQTHRGTERQREWLRTMEPYGEWDFLFPHAELGMPAATVLEWMEAAKANRRTSSSPSP